MKAVQIHAYGGADVLRYEDVAEPIVGDDDVLINPKPGAESRRVLYVAITGDLLIAGSKFFAAAMTGSGTISISISTRGC